MKLTTLLKKKMVLLALVATFTNCSKDDIIKPQTELPPITQTGENTVGCLVDGEVFLPKGSNPLGNPIVTCHYQNINGNFEFGLSFSNNKTNPLRSIHILSNKIEFMENKTYQLKDEEPENSVFANYLLGGGLYGGYVTTNLASGELTITKLVPTKSIISGTFWFDAVNSNGEKVEIREGRFDMQYSQ